MARAPNGHQNGDDNPERTADGYTHVPQRHIYNIRCGHLDYDRPPREDDHGEAHWRCPALFVFDPFAEHDYERLYCAHHRFHYLPGPPSRKPVDLHPFEARAVHPMPSATRAGLTPEERAWADERRRELRNRAIDAGLVSREPGMEG